MNNCNRYECFACVHGKCFALWDTSEQEKCRLHVQKQTIDFANIGDT